MELKQKIVVLYASAYRMDNDRGGISEGVTVSYIYGDSLDPVLNPNNSMGQRPAKGSLNIGRWDKFTSVPGLYEGAFDMAIGSDGKPMLKLSDVDFMAMVSLEVKKSGGKAPKLEPNEHF